MYISLVRGQVLIILAQYECKIRKGEVRRLAVVGFIYVNEGSIIQLEIYRRAARTVWEYLRNFHITENDKCSDHAHCWPLRPVEDGCKQHDQRNCR